MDCPHRGSIRGLIFAGNRTPSPNAFPFVFRPVLPAATPSFRLPIFVLLSAGILALGSHAAAAENTAARNFHAKIEPLLKKYCYDCHGDGMDKGKVAFDELAADDAQLLAKRDVWLAALKNVRAGLMPPPEEEGILRPSSDEIAQLAHWIKYEAFGIDPANPDPGHVTARRLNRIEYRNTIRDLMGYDFNAEAEFPPDDSGNGFDNNGDVLTLSPLLLEKYLSAAETIVDKAVPKVARIMHERVASGRDFRGENGSGERLNARRAANVSRTFHIDQAEKYQLVMELETSGSFDFDPSHCKLICRIDGHERFVEDVVWSERKTLKHDFEVEWTAGNHTVSFEVVPLEPAAATAAAEVPKLGGSENPRGSVALAPSVPKSTDDPARAERRQFRQAQGQSTSVNVRIASVQVRGPLNPKYWTPPENYARFFPRGPAPEDPVARDRYAEEVLREFAGRAYRRPIDDRKAQQLVALAQQLYSQPGHTFEEGIGRAMMAILGSPHFLFRIEEPASAAETVASKPAHATPIDEYSLASRLSYFLWSTMPDQELFRLAGRGELRSQLRAQIARMLDDSRSQAFVRNFTGQWLQARDIEFVPINVRTIFGYNAPSVLRTKEGRTDFDSAFRKMMRSETEKYFDYVLREDRSVLELVDSDYTFLNEKLAGLYGVPGVTGDDIRRVQLPPDSVRGGVLTQGTVLAVTSNPTRTSPVKRGLFILENILGTPPPPPPPNVPDLEESKKEFKDREPKLSEMLAVHRENKLCNSCHSRMDPLGLALENFNALGAWRDTDARQPIDPSGKLITGEKFADVRELKHVLSHERHLDVYRCLTEKMLTYALGRGLEYYDVQTVDDIVDRLEREHGKMSALLTSVIESAPFQKMRGPAVEKVAANKTTKTGQ